MTSCHFTGSDLDTVPVRDARSRNGTPDSGWDDDDEELDLGGLGKIKYFLGLILSSLQCTCMLFRYFGWEGLDLSFGGVVVVALVEGEGEGEGGSVRTIYGSVML